MCCAPRRQLQPDGAEGRLCVGRAESPRAGGVVRLEGLPDLLRFGRGVGVGVGIGGGWGAEAGCTQSAYPARVPRACRAHTQCMHMQSTHRRLESRPHLIDPGLAPHRRLTAARSRACARRRAGGGSREAQRGGATREARARLRPRHAERRGAALAALAALVPLGGGRGTLREPLRG